MAFARREPTTARRGTASRALHAAGRLQAGLVRRTARGAVARIRATGHDRRGGSAERSGDNPGVEEGQRFAVEAQLLEVFLHGELLFLLGILWGDCSEVQPGEPGAVR